MPRILVLLAAITLGLVACDGGGGQLATNTATSGPTTTTVVRPVPVRQLDGPDTPRATAAVLRRVEPALARGDGADDPTLGREQQLAYRALAAHPDWVDRVVADVPAGVRDTVRANVAAGAALGGLTGEAPAGFPAWEILVPQPSTTLRGHYDEAERASGVPWQYLAAIHLVETRVGRIRGLSSAGAQGPMQFIPATWEAHGEGDINDDRDAILAAGRYLASRGAPTDMDRALFSYNNDDRYVAAVRAYADVLAAAPAAYDGYHQWQVFYATVDGTFLLPEGWLG
jgi:hypothetical protein